MVFTNGTFDILHRGHVEYLAAARALGDVLVVGLNTDASIRRIKGNGRPINRNADRAAVLAGLESVNYICFFGANTPGRMIEKLVPDVLVKGADWKIDKIVGRDIVERHGGTRQADPACPGPFKHSCHRTDHRYLRAVAEIITQRPAKTQQHTIDAERLVKKSLKIVLTILGVFLLLLAVLAGVTQTQFFRDRLRAAVLSNLDSLLTADVYLGPLRGNLVTGFSIDSLALSVDGKPVVSAERIDLRYNLWEIPGKMLSVNRLALVHPTVRLIKGNDSVWNISRIVRPAPPDSTPSGPFTWAIILDRLELHDGTIVVADSILLNEVPRPTEAERNFHNFTARGVNLVLAASISRTEKRIRLERFSLDCDAPAVHLKRMTGTFTVTPGSSRVEDLIIETDRSDVHLNASMETL